MPKSRLSSDDRRTMIIEKAAEIFSVKGVIGTRTRDIADACGINEALIYRHFESKEELYREAMVHAYVDAVQSWKSGMEDCPDGLSAVLQVVRQQFIALKENPILCANMWHVIAATIYDPIMREICQKYYGEYNDFTREMIIHGIEDGSIRPDINPCLGMWLIRGLGLSFIMRSIVSLSVSDAANNPDNFCDMLRKLISNKLPEAVEKPEQPNSSGINPV